MIIKVNLENFKCYEVIKLPFSSLTLLTGFNASGKSSTLHSILLLSQALQLCDLNDMFPLNGSIIELGTPGEVLFDLAKQKKVAIEVECKDLSLCINLDFEKRSENAVKIDSIKVQTTEEIVTFSSLKQLHSSPLPIVQELLTSLKDIIFISAIRPQNIDLFPSPVHINPSYGHIGTFGEFAPWWLDKKSDDEICSEKCHPSENSHFLRRQLNAWLNTMFPGTESNVQKVLDTTLVKLEFKAGMTSNWRRPSNIGYGITYIFPILVACLLAKRGQTIIIDSPEAHLHPHGQSIMGKFLAKIASAGVQIIIETHSDHLLNGVRLAIKDEILSVDNINIHFFDHVSEESRKVTTPSVDKAGMLSEWPNGFFDQSEKDLMKLAGW